MKRQPGYICCVENATLYCTFSGKEMVSENEIRETSQKMKTSNKGRSEDIQKIYITIPTHSRFYFCRPWLRAMTR